MKILLKIIVLLVLSLNAHQSFSQGKIDKSKQEIKDGNKTGTQQAGQSDGSSYSTSDKPIANAIAEGCGVILKGLAYATWYTVIGDYKGENHLHSSLTKYPYYNHRSGNYESTDSIDNAQNYGRFDLDNAFLYYNKDLIGNRFTANIRPFQYFYLQAQYHQLIEHNTDGTYSNLSLLNFYFCYDRLRFERFNAGWKLGMCYVANNVNQGGFSFGLDAEAFIVKPVSVYISQQWGSINHVPVNQFQLSGKVHIKRWDLNIGYEHLEIGTPLYDYLSVGAGIHL